MPCLLLTPRFLLLVRRTTVCCIKLMMPNTNIQPTPDKCASTEFGVTLIGKDGLVILAGAESVKSYQTHGFHWHHSGHYYEPSFHQQPPVVCMVHCSLPIWILEFEQSFGDCEAFYLYLLVLVKCTHSGQSQSQWRSNWSKCVLSLGTMKM